MPGTLLPHEILTELTEVAGRIVRRGAHLRGPARRSPETAPGRPSTSWSTRSTRPWSACRSAVGWCRRSRCASSATGLFLQDIGKLALPPSLVHKAGPLAPDEWELMMQHPLLGLQFLRDDTIPAGAKAIVRWHHERWDGTGYPSGLSRRGDRRCSAHRRRGGRLRGRHERALLRGRAAPAPRGSRADPRRLSCSTPPSSRRSSTSFAASRAGPAPRRRSSRCRSRGGGRRRPGRRTGRSR